MRKTYTGVKIGWARGIVSNAGVKEENFQRQVIDLAHILGWRVAHFRNVRIQRKDGSIYYACPVQADGEGWPDLTLVRKGVIIFAELKREGKEATEAQMEWLTTLAENTHVSCYVWRPSDMDAIEELLR